MLWKLFFLSSWLFTSLSAELPLLIVMRAHNAERYVKHAIESLATQENKNFKILFVDDYSTDKTMSRLQRCLKKYGLQERTQIVSYPHKMGSIFSIIRAAELLSAEQVVIPLDADEEFIDSKALSHIAALFANQAVWIAYGNHVDPLEYSQSKHNYFPAYAFSPQTIQAKALRLLPWMSYTFKAFRAGLFRKIKKEDLELNDNPIKPSLDAAFMLPMLEMASLEHMLFTDVSLVNFHGNRKTKDWHTQLSQQLHIFDRIQRIAPYEPLKELG